MTSALKVVQALPRDAPVRAVLLEAFASGWTLPALAHKAGLTHQALYAIIRRPHGDCRASTIRALRKAVSAGLPKGS